MSDFGLTLALQNMYSGPSQQEKNRNEFASLQQMQSYFENQKKKKEKLKRSTWKQLVKLLLTKARRNQ
jgi:hypothetical protein